MACAHAYGEVCGECAQHTVEMLIKQSERFRKRAEEAEAKLAEGCPYGHVYCSKHESVPMKFDKNKKPRYSCETCELEARMEHLTQERIV